MALTSTPANTVATMASPLDPSIPPADGRCLWEKLPLELKDMVYDLAYVPGDSMRPLTKSAWQESEEIRRRQGKSRFRAATFPKDFFVERLLVSKQWCTAALNYYYAHTSFALGGQVKANEFLCNGVVPRPYAQLVTTVSMLMLFPTHGMSAWTDCPRLQTLHLAFDPSYFYDSLGKDISSDKWEEVDFTELDSSASLLSQVAGIPSITFGADFDRWDDSDLAASRDVFAANIKVFEQVARKQSRLPRIDEQDVAMLDGGSLLQNASTRVPLSDDEIPDDESGLQVLAVTRGADLLEWVRRAKRENLH